MTGWFIVIFLASGGTAVGRTDDHTPAVFKTREACEARVITEAVPNYVLFSTCMYGRVPAAVTLK